jgi:hypothetical protein
MNDTPPKTVVEVYPDTHERVKTAAKDSGHSVKRFTSLILDYAIAKFQAGELQLVEPKISEVEAGQ